MSHPGAISCRCNLRISRRRRRIRLRRTALPSAFLMLHPNRLLSRPLGRRNIVNSRLVRRRPSLYTASYSTRRTSRHSRGNPSRAESDTRKAVAPFLAALRKDFPSTLALHACAEAVLLVSAAHMRLKSTFRQLTLSCNFSISPCILAAHFRSSCVPPIRGTPAQSFADARCIGHNPGPKRNNKCMRPVQCGQGIAARSSSLASDILLSRYLTRFALYPIDESYCVRNNCEWRAPVASECTRSERWN